MVIAALAEGESRLTEVLIAEDTTILARALEALGAQIRTEGTTMLVRGTGGRLARPSQEIHLGNNGTAMRLLTGAASLSEGPIVLTGDPRLRKRPLKPLLDALATFRVETRTEGGLGYPPVTIRGGRLRGAEVHLRDIESSQYVSALLIVAPFASGEVNIFLKGRIPSLPYIALTVETMGVFGVNVALDGAGHYVVKSGQHYRGREYRIEGDVSSASYFFLAAALLKGGMRVENINPRTSQGDIGFLALLERLGCRVIREENAVEIAGGEMPGGEMSFDLRAMPDMVPTLAALAALRPGRTPHPERRPSPHQGERPARRYGDRTEEDRNRRRGARRRHRHHGWNSPRRNDCDIQRPPDRHELCRPGACRAGDEDRRGGVRREILPRLLGNAGGAFMNIILMGLRCTGKSTVGRRLAEMLGVPFTDTDEMIEQRTGRLISRIVAEKGWPAFRAEEKAVIRELAGADRGVIALGGGVVCDAENVEVLKANGVFVWLSTRPEAIAARMAKDAAHGAERPSLTGAPSVNEIQAVMAEREPLYRRLADIVVDTTEIEADRVAEVIRAGLRERAQTAGELVNNSKKVLIAPARK